MRKRKYLSAALLVCMILSLLPTELWAGEMAQPFGESLIAGDTESGQREAETETEEDTQREGETESEESIRSETETENGKELEEDIMELADEGDIPLSGSCGTDLTWEFQESSGTLHISGTGDMENYSGMTAPWEAYKDRITAVVIDEGVVSIGECAFSSCTSLTEIIIPDQVETIEGYASSNCTALEKIVILDNVTFLGEKVFDGSTNVTIYGYEDTEAEEYAGANNIPFVPLKEPENPGPDEPGTDEPGGDEPSDELNLSGCTVSLGAEEYVYDGTPKTPGVTVEDGGGILTEDEDYVLIYGNNTNAGIALVTIIGMGDYTGAVKQTFSIEPKSIEDLKINYFTEVNYRGMEVRPGVTITYGQLTLKNLTDYVLNYENNIEVGNAGIIITGTGNYKGEKRLEYAITPKPMSSTLARLSAYSFLSDGKEKKPEVIVMNGRDRLVENQDYTLTYANNIKPGVAMAVLEGMGNFTGTRQIKFTIRIATPVLKSVENTGSGVKVSWKKVSQADGYKLFRRFKGDGKWELVANLKGTSYTDRKGKSNGKTYQYKVYAISDSVLSNPSGIRMTCYLSPPEITSAKSGKPGQITVKWKRNKKAEGYQIQYAAKKDFSDGRKVNISGGKSVKKSISKLKKNKTYYIRIRSYVRSSGEYFSPWSKKMRINPAG